MGTNPMSLDKCFKNQSNSFPTVYGALSLVDGNCGCKCCCWPFGILVCFDFNHFSISVDFVLDSRTLFNCQHHQCYAQEQERTNNDDRGQPGEYPFWQDFHLHVTLGYWRPWPPNWRTPTCSTRLTWQTRSTTVAHGSLLWAPFTLTPEEKGVPCAYCGEAGMRTRSFIFPIVRLWTLYMRQLQPSAATRTVYLSLNGIPPHDHKQCGIVADIFARIN